METYRCAYRDPHSPLTPLPPVCDVTLRETLRDHSPSLIPINKIVLDKCPPPKRKRASTSTPNKSSKTGPRPTPVKILVTSAKTPPVEETASKTSYLQNLKRILTPNSRPSPKSVDFPPAGKRSRFTCFPKITKEESVPMSPRVLKILHDIGQDRYSDVFRREEIDLDVFKILTKGDLMKLGVQEEKDIPVILTAIRLVKNW